MWLWTVYISKTNDLLWEKEITPATDISAEIQIGDPEVKRIQALNTQTQDQLSLSDCLSKFPSWSKALQAVARLIRRIRHDKSTGPSTVRECEDARCIIIRDLQRQMYPAESKALTEATQLPTQSKLFQMDASLDQDGLLKVGGRLKNASLPAPLKHPVIIPKNHPTTKAIIAHYHRKFSTKEKA